jgi:hypothetical protein
MVVHYSHEDTRESLPEEDSHDSSTDRSVGNFPIAGKIVVITGGGSGMFSPTSYELLQKT